VLGRPLHCNLGSSEAFAWANARLLECSNSHPECRRSEGSLLPLRVISIKDHGESFQLRLTRCQIPESYAALSYCWGGDQPVKTTSDTIEPYSYDIPVHDLPRTLLDAVIATRRLGLSYLWIDCICINQDDASEKSIEISKMPDIYAGAYVTLSATRSATASEGFLHDLHRPEPGWECFRLPYACPNESLGSIILFDSSNLDPHPIELRAWTFQEYVLSRRVIKFSACQLHWTCRKTDLFQQDQQYGRTNAPYHWSRALSEMVSIHRFVSQVLKDKWDWMEVVNAYSRRALSKSEDKLLAISGIAEKWAEATGDEYLAGLWRRNLPLGLLWVSGFPGVERPYYRAPSWSWASTDNQVSVFTTEEPAVQKLLILGHQVQTAHPQAPFGAVASGKIVVHGRLRAILLIQSSKTERLWSRDIIPAEQKFVTLYLDTKPIDRDPRTLPAYCLQVCKYNAQTGEGPCGLILTSQDDINFERVGVFRYEEWYGEGPQGSAVTGPSGYQSMAEEQRNFFEGCELRTITLV
jgi:hypothetical protein